MAPFPRPPTPPEKTYKHIQPDRNVSTAKKLPCWLDKYAAEKEAARRSGLAGDIQLEPPEVFISLVVPAYNEEDRLGIMLAEAVEYLEKEFPLKDSRSTTSKDKVNGSAGPGTASSGSTPTGWEILVVSDGSTDATVSTALSFASKLRSPSSSSVRVISLSENRGKGGAVNHGLRHIRGSYAIFADADGATRFRDLGPLLFACQNVEDVDGRGVSVGSRAHLVGSEAVVQRSWMRNFLMHSFHLFLRLLTPPATSKIRDTQCGFKLFSRSALKDIVPYMHMEGWIFDVEMLMLAESAGVPVTEVPVAWKEIKGSKLNVLKDSLGMAWGLAILRAAWTVGVYRRG